MSFGYMIEINFITNKHVMLISKIIKQLNDHIDFTAVVVMKCLQ